MPALTVSSQIWRSGKIGFERYRSGKIDVILWHQKTAAGTHVRADARGWSPENRFRKE